MAPHLNNSTPKDTPETQIMKEKIVKPYNLPQTNLGRGQGKEPYLMKIQHPKLLGHTVYQKCKTFFLAIPFFLSAQSSLKMLSKYFFNLRYCQLSSVPHQQILKQSVKCCKICCHLQAFCFPNFKTEFIGTNHYANKQ